MYSAALYIPEMEESIEAYSLGDHIYMHRKCDKQCGNTLRTFFVRYRKGSFKANQEFVLEGGRV